MWCARKVRTILGGIFFRDSKKENRSMEEAKTADLEDVRAYASGIPAAWIQCRELGHNWGPHTANIIDGGGFNRTLRCRRCTTRRHQVLDSVGAVLHNTYEYPEGYQMERGTGRVSGDAKGIFRLTSIHNTMLAADARKKR